MPVVCPKCLRPNADTTLRCIYCGASVEGAARLKIPDETKKLAERFLTERQPKPGTKQDEPRKKSTHPRISPELDRGKTSLKVIKGGKKSAEDLKSVRVVAAPMEEIHDDAVRKVAEALKIEPYLVRIKLAAGTPWEVRRFSEIGAAKALASNLLAIGLDAYSLTNENFISVPPRLKAVKVSLISGGLRFNGESDDDPVIIKWDEVFLIVCGEIQRKPAEPVKKKRKKIVREPATALKAYEILDVFPEKGRGVRIAEGITNFSGLGKYMLSSSLLNLRWIQNGIESGSSPIVDKGYRLQSMLFRLPLRQVGAILKHGKESNKERVYLDNSRHFDEYSTLVYLHYQKLLRE